MTDEIKTIEMNTEITDEQAGTASGGGWWGSSSGYKSGDTPKFKVGDIVYNFSVRMHYKGRIVAVSTEKSGIRNKEFTYTVFWDSWKVGVRWEEYNKTESDVYESELRLLDS